MNQDHKDKKTVMEQQESMVVESFEGIIPQYEILYFHALLYPAERCLDAFSRYNENKHCESATFLIQTIQEAIGHAGVLSKFFWPPNRKGAMCRLHKKRGEKLRRSLEVKVDSPLSDRKIRNVWEHFDERLDEFLLDSDSGFFLPDCHKGSHTAADGPIAKIFKLIDTETDCLVLLNEKYFFLPIIDEVQAIYERIREKIE